MRANDPMEAGGLPAFFPENLTPAGPLASGLSGPLPSPFSLVEIPLTQRSKPPRVVIADDDVDALDAWRRSAKLSYANALDLRTWQPGKTDDHLGLVEQLAAWQREGWHPDVVAIDINFDDGGKHGVHYIEELRAQPGYAALPVVMATGNQYSDLEQGKLSRNQGKNKTGESPTVWLDKLKKQEPEAILYGKTGDARFLGRIGQGLPDWMRAARRRAWVKLLGKVATTLDAVTIDVREVAQQVVEFACHELNVDHAVVRERTSDGRYKLIAACAPLPHAQIDDLLSLDDVPVLHEIVGDAHAIREPVRKATIGQSAAGKYVRTLAGMRLLGAAAVLGSRPVGFIALLRAEDKDPFDDEVDACYLKILARLVASAIRVSLLRERQTRLLGFANRASVATSRRTVADLLVDILHDELHYNDDANAHVTVRLLNFGTGRFHRQATKGMVCGSPDALAPTDPAYAIYADVVRSNCARRTPAPAHGESTDSPQSVGTQLCVPLSIGQFALGAVHLEHSQPDRYRDGDQSFVTAAAAVGASALERIRVERLLGDLADFVPRFNREDTKALDSRLRDILYRFCGYTVLVDLESSEVLDAPWQVKHLDIQSPQIDKVAFEQCMAKIYSEEWSQTLMGRLVAAEHWVDSWAKFTCDPREFRLVALNADCADTQTADAVLWIKPGTQRPSRALLLMWSYPPPLGQSDVALLATMAQVFSELHERKSRIEELVSQNLIGEQASQIGHVMQHFKHRLRSLTGGQSNHLDKIASTVRANLMDEFEKAFAAARANSTDLACSFSKSMGYVKSVDLETIALRQVVDDALRELNMRLEKVTVKVEFGDEVLVRTDCAIAALIVFSLVENALDAMSGRSDALLRFEASVEGARVSLTVADNGPGMAQSVRAKLFEWGTTNKHSGLGSALPFARARARTLGGELDLLRSSAAGTSFRLVLPAAPYPAHARRASA